MNRPITSAKIENVILKLPKKTKTQNVQDLMASQLSSNKHSELTPLFLKFFRGRNTSISFYEDTITLLPKPDKDTTYTKILQANITNERRCKNPQQNISKPHTNIY